MAAADGESGLQRIEDFVPSLAVIDFLMPGLNGAEVARIAQARAIIEAGGVLAAGSVLPPRKRIQFKAGPPVDLSAYRDEPITATPAES